MLLTLNSVEYFIQLEKRERFEDFVLIFWVVSMIAAVSTKNKKKHTLTFYGITTTAEIFIV